MGASTLAPGRPSHVLNAKEAALVGALRAFHRSPTRPIVPFDKPSVVSTPSSSSSVAPCTVSPVADARSESGTRNSHIGQASSHHNDSVINPVSVRPTRSERKPALKPPIESSRTIAPAASEAVRKSPSRRSSSRAHQGDQHDSSTSYEPSKDITHLAPQLDGGSIAADGPDNALIAANPSAISRQRSKVADKSGDHSPSPLTRSITAAYYELHPRKMSRLTTDDALADAIVASSLAATRAPSPRDERSPSAQPFVQFGHSHGIHSSQHNSNHGATKTSASRPPAMLHTLRSEGSSPSTSSTEGDPYSKHKKKRHFRKHPNRHAEGDRKRWRHAVTEHERKRYEGVWAANKGNGEAPQARLQTQLEAQKSTMTLTSSALDSETVAAVVVKDIWTRSRLPDDTLKQIWDLVDLRGADRLTREEFVVGLWLIDQRLKGRKLPPTVSDSVWDSVRYVPGVRVKH